MSNMGVSLYSANTLYKTYSMYCNEIQAWQHLQHTDETARNMAVLHNSHYKPLERKMNTVYFHADAEWKTTKTCENM